MSKYIFHREVLGEELPFVALALSSRKNLCANPEVIKPSKVGFPYKNKNLVHKFPCPKVRKERDGKIVDARCHALIAPHVRERYASDPTDVSVSICDLYEEFDRNGREGRDSVFSRGKSYIFPGTDIFHLRELFRFIQFN